MMRTRFLVLLLAAGAAGCARPVEYAAPAPAGALTCAVEQAQQLGYERVTGRAERQAIRVSQRIEPPPATAADPQDLIGPDEIRPVLRNPPHENQLLLRHDRGQLRIEVVSVDERGAEVEAGRDAVEHAQMILVRCTG
jgi:hypothetical protein